MRSVYNIFNTVKVDLNVQHVGFAIDLWFFRLQELKESVSFPKQANLTP